MKGTFTRGFWVFIPMGLLFYVLSGFLSVAAARSLVVAVSIAPQRFVVEKIAGDLVDVLVVVPAGAEPHSYEPSPRQMVAISRSRAYFTIGIGLERVWVERFKSINPSLEVIPMDWGVDRLYLPHGGYDPHVWMSTGNMRVMAANTLKALSRLDPAHARRFKAGYRALLRRIGEVEKVLKGTLGRCQGRAFVAMHPAWGYFANQFGMEQLPVEVEGRRPTTGELLALVNRAKRLQVRVVLVEPQFYSRPARVLAHEIGARVVTLDPLDPHWDSMMLELGRVMERACR